MRFLGSLFWASTGRTVDPDETVTKRRPSGLREALMGRSARVEGAASSMEKPSGSLNRCPLSWVSAAADGRARRPEVRKRRAKERMATERWEGTIKSGFRT